MRDRELLRRWARVEEVLLEDEGARVGDFLLLFDQALDTVGAAEPPTPSDTIAARRIAVELWEFDRVTSSRDVVKARRAIQSHPIARSEQFAEHDVRHRLGLRTLDGIDTAQRVARAARGEAEVALVAVPTLKVVR